MPAEGIWLLQDSWKRPPAKMPPLITRDLIGRPFGARGSKIGYRDAGAMQRVEADARYPLEARVPVKWIPGTNGVSRAKHRRWPWSWLLFYETRRRRKERDA